MSTQEIIEIDNDLVSIIVPVYNVAPFIEPCINSILQQTYSNIEIILVDDGSKDESGKLCDEFAAVDSRIRVIHKSNGGLSDARNVGIKNSTGQYLVFVDSDDQVSPFYVEHLKSLTDVYRAEIAICDPVHCYEQGDVKYTEANNVKCFTSEEAIEEMLYQRSFLFTAWGKIFLSSLFDGIQFPLGMLFEDVAIMYKVFDKANRIVYSDAKLYAYMHREGSITNKVFSRRDLDILVICDEMRDYCMSRSDELKQASQVYCVVGALRIYINADPRENYTKEIEECEKYILQHYKEIIKNKKIRKKMKYALYLFRYFRPLMLSIYKYVDRWK